MDDNEQGALMNYLVTIDGVSKNVRIIKQDGQTFVSVEGQERISVDRNGLRDGLTRYKIGDRDPVTLTAAVDGDDVHLLERGTAHRATVVDMREAALSMGNGVATGAVITQMPGIVLRVLVSKGDRVEEGQVVVVVEAMKMENEFKAPTSGVVAEVAVAAQDVLEANTMLLRIDEEEA
jgi:biotin carboxyl carrier protein